MQEHTYKTIDITIKGLGFVLTALSIYFGLSNFNRQQAAAAELEFNRNFWKKQTEVYAEVCRNAGTLAVVIDNDSLFEEKKRQFLTLYYGEMVMVEDPVVDSAMRELKSYVEIVNLKDQHMVNTLRRKVNDIAKACKSSSETYRELTL